MSGRVGREGNPSERTGGRGGTQETCTIFSTYIIFRLEFAIVKAFCSNVVIGLFARFLKVKHIHMNGS